MARRSLTVILWVLIFSSIAYFFINNVPPIIGIGNEPLDQRRIPERSGLIVHLCFGLCALILGAFQFWPGIRNNYPKWHRVSGKLYIGCSIIAALMAFYLLSNYPLPGSVVSLVVLNILWLSTTIIAYLFARKRNFILHRQFMTRSYVCALAFVSIRLLDKINSYSGLFNFIKDEETRATLIDWIGWILPVMTAEFFLLWWPSLKKLKYAATETLDEDGITN